MLNQRVECEWLVATDGAVAGVQPGGAVVPAVEASGKVVHVPLTTVRTLDGEAVSQDALTEWHDAEWSGWLSRHGYDVPGSRDARFDLAALETRLTGRSRYTRIAAAYRRLARESARRAP